MMNVLSGQKVSAEHLLHDKHVVEDIVPLVGPRVPGHPGHEVALFVPRTATSPVAVGGPALIPASLTSGRAQALGRPACAAGPACRTEQLVAYRFERLSAFSANSITHYPIISKTSSCVPPR